MLVCLVLLLADEYKSSMYIYIDGTAKTVNGVSKIKIFVLRFTIVFQQQLLLVS